MGRQPIPEHKRKTEQIMMNVTEHEKKVIKTLAEKRGVPMGQYVRMCVKEHIKNLRFQREENNDAE